MSIGAAAFVALLALAVLTDPAITGLAVLIAAVGLPAAIWLFDLVIGKKPRK